MNKKRYRVDIFIYGDSAGVPFRRKYDTIETWAVSEKKAESNARYRTEGKAYCNEEYGSEGNWSSFDYKAVQV